MPIMIDIETLDTAPTAVVTSIGAVAFSYAETTKDFAEPASTTAFYVGLDIDDQLEMGRTISGPTLAFWAAQPAGLFHQQLAGESSPYEALHILRLFLVQYSSPETDIWCKGAAFDFVLLHNLFKMYGVDWPVNYWQEMCARTIFRTYKTEYEKAKALYKNDNPHHALEDCKTQVLRLNHVLRLVQ